nr:segregation/condensation protein A [Petrotoga miotherma]
MKEKKIAVRKISVSYISDIFVNYVNDNFNDLNSIGEFLELASYLTFLKSKELLPNSNNDKEFRKHREIIYETIENYDVIKKAQEVIKKDFGEDKKKPVGVKNKASIEKEIVENQLVKFFDDYITKQKKLEIIRDSYRIEDAIEMLEKKDEFNILDLYEYAQHKKMNFLVMFLASLILVNRGFFKYEKGLFIKLNLQNLGSDLNG